MSRHESWNLTGDKRAEGADGAGEPTEEPGVRGTGIAGGRGAPSPEAMHRRLAEEFDAWAQAGRADSMETGHMPTAGQALARIHFRDDAPSTFVDLGCGNGYAVRWAAERMHPEGRAIGIDVSERMLDAARAATAAWQDGRQAVYGQVQRDVPPVAEVHYQQATFDDLPFDDGSVDHVFTNEALYYAPDVDAALREVLRVLRPGGTFSCCIDHFEENRTSHDWSDKTGLPMLMDTRDGWKGRLTRAGLVEVKTIRLLDPSPVPPMPQAERQDPARLERYAHLIAWKKEVGSLLLEGTKASA